MQTWIVLLKGVNVGGKHKLPMKLLTNELESLGFKNVKTYIQSGNVILSSELSRVELATRIGAKITEKFDFEPHLVVVSRAELSAAVKNNPFAEVDGEEECKLLHFFFLSAAPTTIDTERLTKYRTSSERCQVVGSVCYLHTPGGFGASKLATQVERIYGVVATARNLRTVQRLLYLSAND